MKLGTAIAELSQLLQRVDDTEWSDAELSSALHRHVLALSRDMAQLDSGYFDHTITALATAARQVKTDCWAYSMPPWIERVVDVREALSTTAPTTASRGYVVPPQLSQYDGKGWRWRGPDTFHLIGWGAALDLEVAVSKRPARPTLGTLPTQANLPASPVGVYLRLDADTSADAAKHPHETLADSYANARIELTGANARSGQFRRVIGSTHFQDEGGTRYTVLQVDRAWDVAPQAGDTYEMHLELADEHMQLVLMLAANTLWGTRGNKAEQRAIAPMIQKELEEFRAGITPRQTQFPYYLRHTIRASATSPMPTEDTQRQLWS